MRCPIVIKRGLGSLLLALLVCLTAAAADNRAQALGHYGIDAERITASGLSSGGYMAVQLGVAYSSLFSGVAIIAAGPYGCAYTGLGISANVSRALGPCMAGAYTWAQRWQCWFLIASCPGVDGPDVKTSVDLARQYAEKRAIDPVTNLRRQRILLISGKKDDKLVPPVVDALGRFYAAFVPPENVREEDVDLVAHTFPTDTFTKGNACSKSEPPYVSDCRYDGAGRILGFLYGALKPRNDTAPRGALVEFDQTRFFPLEAETGMAPTGYVYVPASCTQKDARCALHVALHGCRQTAAEIGRNFVEGAGYNRWADTNDIIVLYPQIGKSKLAANPQNCWDWWGYTGNAWLEKWAPQMQAITAMVRHMSGRPQ